MDAQQPASSDSQRLRSFEEQFLRQLRARAERLVSGRFPADRAQFERTGEGLDSMFDELRRLDVFDRAALEKLPGSLAGQIRFTRTHLGGLYSSTVSRLRARALAPIEVLLKGGAAGPIGREAVLDALARYQVLPRSQQPSGVVFASATGFTPEARRLVEQPGPPTLILMGMREDGGWDVDMSAAMRKTPWAALFDFESSDDRLRRLLYHLEEQGDLLDTRGVEIAALAEKLGLAPQKMETLVRQACRTDGRLMTVVHEGRLHLCRSPLEDREQPMGIWSRVRKWLRMKPTVAERVREMTVQRVRLEQQRSEIDKTIDKLESQERSALQQGAAAASDAERKQVAGRLARLRRDLQRVRAQANIYTQQLDILGTHIHHLTLTEKGNRLRIPSAEELTREAAQAEQVVAQLSTNADLARSIEVGGASPLMQEEELAILEEFRQMAAQPQAAAAPSADPQSAAPAGAQRTPPAPARSAEPGDASKRSAARPEVS